MLNLDSTINLDFKKFLRWWGRELAFLLPESVKQFVSDRQGSLIVRPAEDKLAWFYQYNDVTEQLAEFPRDAAGLNELREFLAKDSRFVNAEIIVRLSDRYAIAKELVFPLAVAENLQQVVAYELDRYTPFKPDQVYFAVKLLAKNKASGQMRGVLVLAPKENVDALYEELMSAGLRPNQVDYEAVDNTPYTYNLLPESLRQKPAILPKIVYGGLVSALMLLLCAVLVLPVWWQNRMVDDLRDKISAIERDAQEVDSLQDEMDALIAQTKQIIDKKRNAPSLLELFNALSALIKDDTWLMYCQYKEGRLQIQGQSPSSSMLIAVLEESKLFTNARFVSPVTQDTRTGLERFQITVDVKAGEQE